MRASVRAGFIPFSAPLEGVVPFMYLDVKGLVTTAIGILIDPVAYALPLPFMRPDGIPAKRDEIAVEWQNVKQRQDLRLKGGMVYKNVTKLRLTDEGVNQAVWRKLDQNWNHLVARFPELPSWPADAQLGLLSWAWAVGPAASWPMFCAALRAQKFALAAAECTLKEAGNPGVIPRNVANRVLFLNAARVLEDGLDPDVLYWPHDLRKPRPVSASSYDVIEDVAERKI